MGSFLTDFIEDRKIDIENKKMLKSASYEECLEDLFGDSEDEWILRRARVFYLFSNDMKSIPRSEYSVYQALMHKRGLFPKCSESSPAESSVINSAYHLTCEAGEHDPSKAKALIERLFNKYPELLQSSINVAREKDTEKNLVFLCCAILFGWDKTTDVSELKNLAKRIHALDEIRCYTAFMWVKEQADARS